MAEIPRRDGSAFWAIFFTLRKFMVNFRFSRTYRHHKHCYSETRLQKLQSWRGAATGSFAIEEWWGGDQFFFFFFFFFGVDSSKYLLYGERRVNKIFIIDNYKTIIKTNCISLFIESFLCVVLFESLKSKKKSWIFQLAYFIGNCQYSLGFR